jgi:hypothetical protein
LSFLNEKEPARAQRARKDFAPKIWGAKTPCFFFFMFIILPPHHHASSTSESPQGFTLGIHQGFLKNLARHLVTSMTDIESDEECQSFIVISTLHKH